MNLADEGRYALLAQRLKPYLQMGGSGSTTIVSGGTGVTDHGLLTGLGDDDHTQYYNTVRGDARWASLYRTLTAGNGLTGGGTLAADRTFTVGAGAGITVNADDVALTTPGTLTVSTTNSATGSHTHAVTASADTGTTPAAALLKSDQYGGLRLAQLAANNYVRTAQILSEGGDLDIAPTGDVTFNPTGNDVILTNATTRALRSSNYAAGFPLAGFRIGTTAISGQYGMNIGTMEADELRARIFVADETRVDRGQEYITKSYGILSRAFTTPSAISGTVYIYVENSPHIAGAVFSTNDWVMLRYLDMSSGITLTTVWGTVVAYDVTGLTGEQRWTFTLQSGSTDLDFAKGAMVVCFGASGQGYILSDAVSSTSPFIQIGTWATNPYTPANRSVRTQIGRLDGVGFTGENGLYAAKSSTEYIAVTDTTVLLRNVPIQMYNGATWTGSWTADGSLALGNGVATSANRTFSFDGTTSALRVGGLGTNKGNLYWDGSALHLRQNTTNVITLDSDGTSYFAAAMSLGTSGGIYQGTGSFGTPTTGLKIWNDSGVGRIAGYNGGTLQWGATTAGKLSAGAGAVTLDAAGLTLGIDSTLGDIKWTDGTSQTAAISHLFLAGGTDQAKLTMQANGVSGLPNAYVGLVANPYSGGAGTIELSGSLLTSSATTSRLGSRAGAGVLLQLGYDRTADGSSSIEYFTNSAAATTATLLVRRNSGANGNTDINHYGTGQLAMQAIDAGYVILRTNSTTRLAVYPAGEVRTESGFYVNTDPGAGISGYLGLTDVTSGVSTGTGTVKMNGTTARNSTGWLKIYVGTDARYIPYWTDTTG